MNAKWMRLAGEMLDVAKDEFSNHVCNDWDFPDDWTHEEKVEFVKAMHDDNGSPEEFDPEHLDMPDWWIMAFLAGRLKEAK
jgi:hypothetical protein